MGKIIQIMVILSISGFLGAYLSVMTRRAGWSSLWILVCTLVSTLVWLWMVKSDLRLTYASVMFDVVYGFSYFIGFVVMGEVSSLKNWIGMLLAIVGLVLVSL